MGASRQIDRILNLERWQALQDRMAEVTGLAIVTVDYKGDRVTRHSLCRPFCERMRSSAAGEQCRVCDSRAGIEAARANGPHISLCHCGVVDVAIPIIVDDTYMGALMAGQVRLDAADGGASARDTARRAAAEPPTELGELDALYRELPVVSLESVESAARALNELVNYAVHARTDGANVRADGVHAHVDGARAHGGPSGRGPQAVDTSLGPDVSADDQAPRASQGFSAPDRRVSPQAGYVATNRALQPAFDRLLSANRTGGLGAGGPGAGRPVGADTSLRACAQLCGLTPSYFGRAFAHEAGESFAHYAARLKIGHAKQLLSETSLSVAQVAARLGFSDSGYFIRQFRRFEGVTPGAWREGRSL